MKSLRFWIPFVLEIALIAALSAFHPAMAEERSLAFLAVFLAAGGAYLIAVSEFFQVAPAWRPRVLWGGAILLQILVFWIAPTDDFWRYIWEGRLQLHHLNPYLLSPDAPSLTAMHDAVWQKMNHRHWAAIYPPGAEWMFEEIVRITSALWFFKLIFSLANLLVIHLLLRLNTGVGRYRATAWYAWNPAVIYAFAGLAHYDCVMILAMTAALWALHRANPMERNLPTWDWALLSAVFLGLAISLKTIPLLLVPVWIIALRWRSVVLLVSGLIFSLMAIAYGGFGVVLDSLHRFAHVARFNDLVLWLAEKTVWANPAQKNGRYTIAIIVIVCALTVIFRRDWRRAALWIFGAALIFSPVLHPWYILWILPLACWRRAWPWAVFAISVWLCKISFGAGIGAGAAGGIGAGALHPPVWVRGLEVLPALLAIAFFYWKNWSNHKKKSDEMQPTESL